MAERLIRIVGAVCSLLFFAIASAGQSGATSIPDGVCGKTTWQLTGGQSIDVGTVTVANDADYLYIEYETKDGWTLEDVQAWVGTDLDNLPRAGGGGAPINGHFPFKAGSLSTTIYTFKISFDELLVQDKPIANLCPNPWSLYVVTHASVTKPDGSGGTQSETAFGGDNPVDVGDPGRWWFYGQYEVCCTVNPPVMASCETGFAFGDHVFAKNKKANPDKLTSLELTRMRWGWANNMQRPGSIRQTLWAGAGLNDTGKGIDVGTVTMTWDGSFLDVAYNVVAPYHIEEVHIYASDTPPTTIAPGQYGHTAYFEPGGQTTYDASINVKDTDGDGIWIIAHAVVCMKKN